MSVISSSILPRPAVLKANQPTNHSNPLEINRMGRGSNDIFQGVSEETEALRFGFQYKYKYKRPERFNEVHDPVTRGMSEYIQSAEIRRLYPGVINLGQGKPGDDPEPRIVAAMVKAVQTGNNQYTAPSGDPELLSELAKKYTQDFGLAIQPQNILVTAGGTAAMAAALSALLEPGDKVIVNTPCYDNFVPQIKLLGGKPLYAPLVPPDDKLPWYKALLRFLPGFNRKPAWIFDRDALEKAFQEKPKAIILNTPHNPTGKVFTPKELTWIAALCKQYGVIPITDETYENILFEKQKHVSMASILGQEYPWIVTNSISKSFDATGWRVGWAMTLDPEIKQTMNIAGGYSFLCAPSNNQKAAAEALRLPPEFYRTRRETYQKRQDILMDAITKAGFKTYPVEGAYYIFADATDLCRKLKAKDDIALVEFLVKKFGLGVLPGYNFFPNNQGNPGREYIRISYCKNEETLRQAADKLNAFRAYVAQGKQWESLPGPALENALPRKTKS